MRLNQKYERFCFPSKFNRIKVFLPCCSKYILCSNIGLYVNLNTEAVKRAIQRDDLNKIRKRGYILGQYKKFRKKFLTFQLYVCPCFSMLFCQLTFITEQKMMLHQSTLGYYQRKSFSRSTTELWVFVKVVPWRNVQGFDPNQMSFFALNSAQKRQTILIIFAAQTSSNQRTS